MFYKCAIAQKKKYYTKFIIFITARHAVGSGKTISGWIMVFQLYTFFNAYDVWLNNV